MPRGRPSLIDRCDELSVPFERLRDWVNVAYDLGFTQHEIIGILGDKWGLDITDRSFRTYFPKRGRYQRGQRGAA